MIIEEEDLELIEKVVDEEIESGLVIQPIPQQGCRICRWAETRKDLYNWVSKRALQGIPYATIDKLLREYINESYPGVKPVHRKSVMNHFDNHIPLRETSLMSDAQKQYMPSKARELLTLQAIEQLENGSFDEYKELCALFVKFRETHDQIYKTTMALQANNKDGVWAQNKITTYVAMVNAQRSILSEIAKMRQGNKLIDIAAKFILEMFVKNIMNRLDEEFSALSRTMRRNGVGEEVIAAFEQVTSNRLADILVDEADSAMIKTRKEFKLPN